MFALLEIRMEPSNIFYHTSVTETISLRCINIEEAILDGMWCSMSQQPPWQPQQTPNGQSQWGQNMPPQSQASFYNQTTQATPGQFQQSSSNYIPPSGKPGLWGWYKSRTRRVKLSIGCGTFLALLLFFFCIGTALGRANPSSYAHQSVTDQTHTSQAGQTPTTYPLAPGGYLASGSNYVLFLQFTNTNGMLLGEWNEADVVPSTSTNVMQVNPFHTSFSALLNGTQFNLNVNGHTYAGSFDGNNVTIEFPQQDGTLAPITLTPSSIDDYNTAISNLQSTVNQENQNAANAQATASTLAATATATTDEQNRLNYDLQNIGSAIGSLNSDANFSSLFGQYQNDLNQEQQDYQTEQNDASGGCSNASQVSADVNQVQADTNQITADDNQFQADKNQISSDVSVVQDFVNKIAQHWNDLGKTSPGVTQNDIDTAVHNGNTALQNAQAAISSANSQIHGYDATSQQILQQANNLYSSMKC